ncbi:MAG: methyltransferase domain-containing protein [Pseudomonadota bacterium]
MTSSDTTLLPAPPTTRFWDRIADRYAKKPIADEAAYQIKLETTRAYLRPDMDVLEFGCGTGSTALLHAPFVKHLVATDLSPRMIDIARDKAAAADVANVSFVCTAIERFDAPHESFDAVLGLSILHLLEDPEAVVGKVHRLLKPGGVFVSSTVCLADGMAWFKPILFVGRRLGLLPLVRFFGADHLAEMLVAQGFTIEHRWSPPAGKGVFIVARKTP